MTKTSKITYTAIFAAIATVLMYFEFPIPFMPPFLKVDLSGAVVLIGAFIFGIAPAITMIGIKDIIHLTQTQTGGSGEVADFLMLSTLVVIAVLLYRGHKSRKMAVLGCAAGSVAMACVGMLTNYFLIIPFYSQVMPLQAIFDDPLRDITDVCCTRLHIFVVECAEHRLKVLAVDKARVLRANLLIRYNVCHALNKIRVVEHHQMCVKNFRLSRTDILFRIVTQHFDLLLGFFHCVKNALAFGFHIGNGLLNDRKIFFLDHESLCLRQTLRNADSLEFNHGVFLRFYDCIFIQISQPNLYYIVQHPHTFVKQIKFFLQTDIYF